MAKRNYFNYSRLSKTNAEMSGWEIKEFPSLWEKSDPTISEKKEQPVRSSMLKSADRARDTYDNVEDDENYDSIIDDNF